jgi:hypothetical protein
MAEHEYPKWRLQANFLLRELARLWYGKESILSLRRGLFGLRRGIRKDVPFWRHFVYIFREVAESFGEEHGLCKLKMRLSYLDAIDEWEACHGRSITFSEPYWEARWIAKHILGDGLFGKLTADSDIKMILYMAKFIYGEMAMGKLPPYESDIGLQPLTYYEVLPVDPELVEQYYAKNTSQKS